MVRYQIKDWRVRKSTPVDSLRTSYLTSFSLREVWVLIKYFERYVDGREEKVDSE